MARSLDRRLFIGASYHLHGRVAVVTLDNPPVNGLGHDTRSDVVAGIDRANADAACDAIVVTGGGKAFSGGADIREFNTPKASAEPAQGSEKASERPESDKVRIAIPNGRPGLVVKVDGQVVSIPLRLPRDMKIHELVFSTPNFRSESRKIRADRDQTITLENKPGFYVP